MLQPRQANESQTASGTTANGHQTEGNRRQDTSRRLQQLRSGTDWPGDARQSFYPDPKRLCNLLAQDLDVPVRSIHADPLPIPDQPGGVLHPTTAGKPYSRAITAPWVIKPPTCVTRPLMVTNTGDQLGSV